MAEKLYARYTNPNAGFYPPEDLILGERYEVKGIEMGGYYTSVYLAGRSGVYNSVNFDFLNEDGSEKNIFTDPKYNPYIGVFRRGDNG